jgi:acetyl esterase/lipase
MGISENIREVYSFIAANYMAGDEIILIGFSRGAFTVRSVASMIRDIGLLNRRGMEYFYPIFKDQENFRNDKYNDIFPTIPFAKKPDNPRDYRERLEQVGKQYLLVL